MSRCARILVAICVVGFVFAATAQADEVRKSVVKIFSAKSPPNPFKPWEITSPSEVTGSGVLLEDGRILTNAHVVAYSHQVYVQPYESSEKLDATIEFLAQECDLATLTLDDPEAIADLKPVTLADGLPAMKDKVNVLGYPVGGETLSVTEGVVSRIEWSPYFYGTSALRIQVDAAINPGNSGGPAVIDGKIAGIVFSRFNEGENIGYLIPAPVVKHFLDDCTADNKFDGFPKIGGLMGATLENPTLRKYLGLKREQTGIVIHKNIRADLKELIKPWDVVTSCDGIDVDNLGMVSIAEGVRVRWGHLISRKPAGSTVKLGIFREGQEIEVEVSTVTKTDSIIQRMTGDRPSYFIYGGLVFSPITTEMTGVLSRYLGILGGQGSILTTRINDQREDPDEELVTLCCPILPHKTTKGYGASPLSIVTHVNDVPIKNLRQMVSVIKENQEPYVVFRFENDREEKVVLDPKLVEKAMPEILRNNVIPAVCSEDLHDLWP